MMKSEKPIQTVVEYLKRIETINKTLDKASSFVVYRGEPVVYDTPGMPGIFREEACGCHGGRSQNGRKKAEGKAAEKTRLQKGDPQAGGKDPGSGRGARRVTGTAL